MAGPSSRDLGETHLIWHWKSGQVILDIYFLRSRHKLPWALCCCCLYLHCTSSCRPGRALVPLCQPPVLWLLNPGRVCGFQCNTVGTQQDWCVCVNLWAQSLHAELNPKTHDMATQENHSSLEELQDTSSSLSAWQSEICTQSSCWNFCKQHTKTFFCFST